MVFYRKYRPQTIAQLDNPKLRETITAVLSQKEIPHAYLFTGPKGLGKTSTARIIAKILNCTGTKRDGIEPCNVCDQCVSITNGNNIDVLEIDGASNRGIDEIRDLKEKINLAPVKAAKKVYIIDEVHMLTTEAFNALLKTIEEPPSHVVFIFATTEPQKVPATIISRCFHVSLQKATKEELIHALKRIAKEEKIAIDDDALDLIAEMGDGGYRDATKIVEELVALSGGKRITKAFIQEHNNTTGISLDVSELFSALKSKNATEALRKIEAITNQGTSIKYFLEQSLSQLHHMLLGNEGIGKYPANCPDFTSHEIATLFDMLSGAHQQTKYAVIQSLPLELAVVEFCQQQDVISGPKDKQSSIETPIVLDNNNTGGMSMQDAIKKEQNLKVKQVLSGGKNPSALPGKEPQHVQENLPKDIHNTQQLMENLIYKVKAYNHSVAGVLRGCRIQSVDATQIVFEAAYPFHKEKLDEQKIHEILEKVVREITGKDLRVMVELKK